MGPGTRTDRLRGGRPTRELLLAPGQRHELATVLGEHLLDGVARVEKRHTAVRLDARLALDDDAAQDPRMPVDVEVALDVDEPAIGESGVAPQVTVDVEEPLPGDTVEP